jgi:predicted DNA-binding transcriptional regulator AlpA
MASFPAGILSHDYLTSSELAKELGRSIRTLDRWVLTGDGPPRTRIGRKTLYRRAAVLDWLKSREIVPARRRKQRVISRGGEL